MIWVPGGSGELMNSRREEDCLNRNHTANDLTVNSPVARCKSRHSSFGTSDEVLGSCPSSVPSSMGIRHVEAKTYRAD